MFSTTYTGSSNSPTITAYLPEFAITNTLEPSGEYSDTFTWGYKGHGPLETAKAILTHHHHYNGLATPTHAEIRQLHDEATSRFNDDFHLVIDHDRT